MNNKPLTLICVQPCIKYYAWQVEVMLNNFKDQGITKKYDVRCLFAYNKNEHDWEEKVSIIKKLEASVIGTASFFYYEDTRVYPISYISSIRPNLLKQHFHQFPELSTQPIFYHDCDIVFTKFPDFLDNLLHDNNWYVSDTRSYIGHQYIVSKGEEVLDKMCEIVGIDKSLVEQKENQSGGAQYLLKGVDYEFFHKMEIDCERLYREINILSNGIKSKNPSYHELQIWCADMWAILWGAWIRGYDTVIIPEMEFCWATDSIQRWEEKYIFHNAGVVDAMKEKYFYKGQFRDSYPYSIESESYDRKMASYNYDNEIKKTSIKSCLL